MDTDTDQKTEESRKSKTQDQPLTASLGDIAQFRKKKLRTMPKPRWVPFVVAGAAILGFVYGRFEKAGFRASS
jgi:hypothetical protein